MKGNKKNEKKELVNQLVARINGLILRKGKKLTEATVSDYAFAGGTLGNFKILHKMLFYFLTNNLVKNGFIVVLNDKAVRNVLSIIESE